MSFSHNNIGDKGAQDLAEALRENTTLTKLYLWGNKIGDKGAQAFVVLGNFNNLRHLHLAGNENISQTTLDAIEEFNVALKKPQVKSANKR